MQPCTELMARPPAHARPHACCLPASLQLRLYRVFELFALLEYLMVFSQLVMVLMRNGMVGCWAVAGQAVVLIQLPLPEPEIGRSPTCCLA